MGRFAHLVMGPAGSGKSTFCAALARVAQEKKRHPILVNLDPAAEDLRFEPTVDVRELVSLEDVTAVDRETGEVGLGPNGGLVFCLEYLAEHLEWLQDELLAADDSDDAFFIVDCPGQIELYTHVPAMAQVVRALRRWGYMLSGVFLVDGSMVAYEPSKYLSGLLLATSAMVQLELPWINVLSKMDLVAPALVNRVAGTGGGKGEDGTEGDAEEDAGEAEHEGEGLSSRMCDVDFEWIRDQLADSIKRSLRGQGPAGKKRLSPLEQRWSRLNSALCDLVEDFSMVRFLPLDAFNPESVEFVLEHMDHVTQFGEDAEPMEPKYDEAEEEAEN